MRPPVGRCKGSQNTYVKYGLGQAVTKSKTHLKKHLSIDNNPCINHRRGDTPAQIAESPSPEPALRLQAATDNAGLALFLIQARLCAVHVAVMHIARRASMHITHSLQKKHRVTQYLIQARPCASWIHSSAHGCVAVGTASFAVPCAPVAVSA
eukprot:scaffold31327_cov23-Tisochrysis_lutea.AAC.1